MNELEVYALKRGKRVISGMCGEKKCVKSWNFCRGLKSAWS